MNLVDQINATQDHGENALPIDEGANRTPVIIRTCIVGIVGNAALVIVKLVIGAITNSVAIISDGINNLADTLGSVLLIIGMMFSQRKPNRKHPHGYGRIEYIITIMMGAIILFAGASALNQAITSILTSETPSYEPYMLFVLAGAAVVRLVLGMYYKRQGKALNSDSLIASGTDSVLDAIITAATIVAALIFMATGISTEAYLAIAISLVILKAGFEVLMTALSKILGQRVSPEVSKDIRATIADVPGVMKACDLRLVDYGPERIRGSVYIELDEHLTIAEADRIAQAAQLATFMNCGVHLDAVGIQPVSCADEETLRMRKRLEEIALKYDHVLDMHGFRLKEDTKLASFSVVADFSVDDREALADDIAQEATREFPNYRFLVTTVSDFAD